jgi:uncharacterized protein
MTMLVVFLLLWVLPASAQTFPKLTGRVVDQANLLTPEQELVLTKELESLEKTTSDQLVIVTLPTLHGRRIERVGLELVLAWKSGRADLDNGFMLVVAPNDRKVRIEVGYGLEGLLTDHKAAAIVKHMLPKFRSGDMSGAIRTGALEIEKLLLQDRKRPRYLTQARKRLAA